MKEKMTDYLQNQFLQWKSNAIRKKIGIIGGGVAGLGTLRTLCQHGICDVILLEAQDYLGGRVRTYRQGSLHVEDGAEWIHGGRKNIVFRIAQKLGQLRNKIAEDDFDIQIVREDGSRSKDDARLMQQMDSLIEETEENGVLEHLNSRGYGQYFIQRLKQDLNLTGNEHLLKVCLHYIEQMVNSDEGTDDWNEISAVDADAWRDLGTDRKWINGFETLVHYLIKPIPPSTLNLKANVTKIFWDLHDTSGALLVTEDGRSYLVDHVIVTTSVGCLKRWGESLFTPVLPNDLKSALQGIELGGSNKVMMGWSQPWWSDSNLDIRILWSEFALPQDKNWLYGIVNITSVEGNKSILRVFLSGKYSREMETLEEEKVQSDFVFLLKTIFQRDNIPQHNFFRRTRWNSNPWTCGSYGSYITPEGSRGGLNSREPFRQPIINQRNEMVILWAGEHTHDTRYGTVDGALATGIREAKRILQLLKVEFRGRFF